MATLCICIPDDLASNLGRDTGYPDWGFRSTPQFLQGNSRIRPRLPPSWTFPFHQSSYHTAPTDRPVKQTAEEQKPLQCMQTCLKLRRNSGILWVFLWSSGKSSFLEYCSVLYHDAGNFEQVLWPFFFVSSFKVTRFCC
jgi:hypothetical protein